MLRRAVIVGFATLVILTRLVSTAAAADDPSKAEAKKTKVAVISVKGSLPENAGQVGLFAEIEQNLSQLLGRLDRAAKDKEISAVLLEVRGPDLGRGKMAELRAGIKHLREAKKLVVADVESGSSVDYLVACACDAILMPESGDLILPGVRAEVTHYKGLLDKLGIQADMMQMGDYKGAAEPYTRTEMSPEFRKQLEAVIDDVYNQFVETIAADRKLDAVKVRELVDLGLIGAAEAKQAGLIDRVLYRDEIDGFLKEKLSVTELSRVEDYGKKKIDEDFSGMTGFFKLFELMMGVEPTKRSSSAKKVAVVYASGMIMPGKSTSGLLSESLGSDTVIKALETASKDKTVVAIVLRVDSPGGSALASDLIWRTISRCGKPVVASMGDVAASGGYYISMGCDKIFAEPGTLTGSIGVVGGKLATGGLFEKLGIHTDVISRGKNSGIMTTESPFTESERGAWKKMMEETYKQFVSKASAGRKMSVEQLGQLAGGRIWTGRQAKENKLVDEVGTLQDAIQEAKKMAGVAVDEKTELLLLPEPRNLFDDLFGGDMAIKAPAVSRFMGADPALLTRLRNAETWARLLAEPVFLALPYQIEIR